MSEQFWKRLNNIFGLMVLAGIFGYVAFTANIEVKDLDLWLHIGMGRYIVQHGFQVPSADMLSCTITGTPWVNHEWLFQVVVYHIYEMFGPDGLIDMQVGLVILTMLILVLIGYNKEKQLSSLFLLLLLALVYRGRFTIRPDLFSLLFFAIYIYILSFHIDRKWSLYVLIAVQILWTNMHGFFFFGPLFVLIGIGAEWIKRHVPLPYYWNHMGRLTDEEYGRMKVVFFFVTLACLVNPMGLHGAWYPLKVFFQISGESKIFFNKIVELRKPITLHSALSMDKYPFYKLMIILSFSSFVYNRRKIDIGALIFWLVFLVFSLAAVRNLTFFAFAAFLTFVTNAMTISLKDVAPVKITDKTFMHMTGFLLRVLLIIWLLQHMTEISRNGYYDFDHYRRKSEYRGVSLRSYPEKAVDFLVENHVKGRFFNDFNTGAYLVGRTSPNIKVFIDGRTEVYGPEFFKFYQQIWEKENVDEFKEALETYDLTGVLMSSVHQPIPHKILKAIYEDKDWVPVYFDYDGLIFLKDIEENRALIDRFRLDLTQWKAKELDILKIGSVRVTPYPNMNRSYSLLDMGLNDQAEAEARAAVKVAPNYYEPYKVLGKVAALREDYVTAFENFRAAVVMNSNNKKMRLNMALAYYDMGEYEYAVRQYTKVTELAPNDPEAYFRIAMTRVKQEKFDAALQVLGVAHQVNPDDVADILKIGDMLLEAGQPLKAKQAFELALTTGKNLDEVRLKMGEMYADLGQSDLARQEYEQGLKENPENEDLKNKLEYLPEE